MPVTLGTATVAGKTLTVLAESSLARIEFTASGGVVGEPLYITRRDRAGTALVRETSAGSVLWQAGTPTTAPAIVDYEARQGLETDYTLTDLDGAPLVTVRVTIPQWGSWLKSPGKPHQNLKCDWQYDSTFARGARQTVIPIRGAKFPIVQTDARTSPEGQITVVTDTSEQARAFVTLVADGGVLMVDVPDSYGVPVRYVSAGALAGSRLPGDVLIEDEVRRWSMDVVEVAPPVGLPAGQGFTYTGLQATADSYIALAATYVSYDLMTVGEV